MMWITGDDRVYAKVKALMFKRPIADGTFISWDTENVVIIWLNSMAMDGRTTDPVLVRHASIDDYARESGVIAKTREHLQKCG